MNKEQEEVWNFIQTMNRLWVSENRAADLKDYFHKRMIAVTPTDNKRIEGGDACVAGWADFAAVAKTLEWEAIQPQVELYDDNRCAVVSYYYRMTCEIGGQTIKFSGRDLFSLVKESGRWWVVADQFSAFPNPDQIPD